MKSIFPILLTIYVIEFVILGISPVDRSTWVVENLPMLMIVLGLLFTYKKIKFSNLSYIMMFVLIYLHTIGGHYTFANVPFRYITDLFGFERNHFDRIAHFSVGFYAFPFAEILQKIYKIKAKFILILFPVFFIISVAAIYEIIEWWFAVIASPEDGIAFLGSQGDIWDAQKDMLADTLGAIFAIIVYTIFVKKKE